MSVTCPCPRCLRYKRADANIERARNQDVVAQCVDCGALIATSVALLIGKRGEHSCAKCAKGRAKS